MAEDPDNSLPQWVKDATDEHASAYDPNDAIPKDEAEWMLREIGSSIMTPDMITQPTKLFRR